MDLAGTIPLKPKGSLMSENQSTEVATVEPLTLDAFPAGSVARILLDNALALKATQTTLSALVNTDDDDSAVVELLASSDHPKVSAHRTKIEKLEAALKAERDAASDVIRAEILVTLSDAEREAKSAELVSTNATLKEIVPGIAPYIVTMGHSLDVAKATLSAMGLITRSRSLGAKGESGFKRPRLESVSIATDSPEFKHYEIASQVIPATATSPERTASTFTTAASKLHASVTARTLQEAWLSESGVKNPEDAPRVVSFSATGPDGKPAMVRVVKLAAKATA